MAPPPDSAMQQQEVPGVAGLPQVQGLPATGLQQQLSSIQAMYQRANAFGQAQGLGNINPATLYAQQALPGGGASQQPQGQPSQQFGQTNIQQLARTLAQSYGLPLGRGELVDPQGNLLQTPDQLSAASGGSVSMGVAAAKLNYISQAIAKEQNRQQQEKGIAAMQAGMGLVQSRGRGSLAALQSGMYQGLADLYANQEYESADYSYFIQKEYIDMQREMQRRAEKLARKKARARVVGGVGLIVAGSISGQVAMIGQGVAMTAEGSAESGWF